MPKFLAPIDMGKNEIRNMRLQNLSSAPASPVAGLMYYDTTQNCEYFHNGTEWVPSDARKRTGIPIANLATDPLARANHTGTQLANTISNFDTQVRTSRLDQMAAPSAAIAMSGQKITGLGAPTAGSSDAARISDVEAAVVNAAAGIDSKPSVRAVATSNITLSGTQTVDTVALVAGDSVLVTGQTTGSQNGVYLVAAGAWTRRTTEDGAGEITPGAFWFVEEGTANAGSQWRCSNTGTITIGTTNLTIVKFGVGQVYTASGGLQLVGTNFSANLDVYGGITVNNGKLALDNYVSKVLQSAPIGDGSSTQFVLSGGIFPASMDVTNVTVFEISTGDVVYPDIRRSTGAVTLFFGVAPAVDSLMALVHYK